MQFRNIATSVISTSMLIVPAIMPASALALDDGHAEIAVSQEFSSNIVGGDRKVEYALFPTEASNPMPEGAADGRYTFELDDDAKDTLKISFPETGNFEYTLACTQPDAPGYTYDATIYRVKVSVQVGNGATRATALIYDPDENKVESAAWKVIYDSEKKNENANNESSPSGSNANNGSAPSSTTPSGGSSSDGSSVPKMEDIIPGIAVGFLAAIGLFMILAAIKRRRKDDEEDER